LAKIYVEMAFRNRFACQYDGVLSNMDIRLIAVGVNAKTLDKTTSSIHTVPRSLITRLRVILRGFLPFLENERRLDGFPVGMAFDGVIHSN
jgi:hypothetical protein